MKKKIFVFFILILFSGCFSNVEKKNNIEKISEIRNSEIGFIDNNNKKEEIAVKQEYEKIAGAIWIESIGESILDGSKTVAEAELEALNKARINALESAHGIEIKSEMIVRNSMLLSNFIYSKTSGRIIKEHITENSTYIIKDNQRNIVIYKIKANFAIKQNIKENNNKNFNIISEINKKDFMEGENAELKIIPSDDSYIYIFNLYGKENADLIYPNAYSENNFIKSGENLKFPKDGLEFILMCSEGFNISNESFYIIALKDKYDFNKMLGMKTTFGKLNELISEIQNDKYADAYLSYTIRKTGKEKK